MTLKKWPLSYCKAAEREAIIELLAFDNMGEQPLGAMLASTLVALRA